MKYILQYPFEFVIFLIWVILALTIYIIGTIFIPIGYILAFLWSPKDRIPIDWIKIKEHFTETPLEIIGGFWEIIISDKL